MCDESFGETIIRVSTDSPPLAYTFVNNDSMEFLHDTLFAFAHRSNENETGRGPWLN